MKGENKMLEWEDMLALTKILDSYDINYELGDYYDEEGVLCGHWLEINCFIDCEDNDF